jgi:hypothetical protein
MAEGGVLDDWSSGGLDGWREGLRVGPVAPDAEGRGEAHVIHAYFNISPESPDGRLVLFYRSAEREGHHGSLCVLERASGAIRELARDVETEDAHRTACQQWVRGGRTVVFHAIANDTFRIVAVDVASGEPTVLAEDRLVGWASAAGSLVPAYGPHWARGRFRDLELIDAATGERTVPVTAEELRRAYGRWVEREFGGAPISIFFPILSPDERRVFLKVAMPRNTDFRSWGASKRKGLVAYDIGRSRFLSMREDWGHPAWHPDCRTMLNVPNVLIDVESGAERPLDRLPRFPGSHPSFSPDGRLFVTDTRMQVFGGSEGEWGIVVVDIASEQHVVVARFDHSGGAASWRPPHPHPVFSPDGRRIYFNQSSGPWTALMVAEAVW